MLRNPGLRKSVEHPVLDLNFAAAQIGSNGAPDSRIDFSRGSNAWFVDSDGLVKKSPHNLILSSETIVHNSSGWLIAGGSLEASAEAPDGIDGSTKVTWTGTGQLYNLVSGIVAGQTYRFSYYVKLGTKINNRYAVYDHTNNAFIISSAVTSGVSSSEWTRVNFTVTAPSGCTQIRFYPDRADSGGEAGTTFITGVQVSQHTTLPVDNPYVKTEGSAVYAARLDHDPSWFMSAAQEQNLLRYSEMLDDSYWTKSAVSVTANAETDPLGGTTAEYVFATSPSGIFPAVFVDFDVAKGVVHTLSFYAKKGERDRIHVDNQNPGPVFNENVISNAELTSEWQRFTGTFTPDENTSRLAFYFGSGAKTWSGDQGFYLWGLQVEVGSTASTYHRTEGVPYYGPGATPKGLLVEEARTNAVPYSEDFSASGLNPGISPANSVTITSNAALAPDGTNTATELIAASASGNSGHLIFKIVDADNDTTVTASVFMKNAGQGWGYLTLSNSGYASAKNAYADLENGVLGASSDSSATIEDYGDGWYRVSVTNTTDSDGGNDVVGIGIANGDAGTNFTGDDTNGIFVWGLQQENGATLPTSYIQTTGSTATRNADVATMGPTTGGTELVTNGTFDTDSDWTLSTGWSITGGEAVASSAAQYSGITSTTLSLVAGRRYRASMDVVSYTAGSVDMRYREGGSIIANTGDKSATGTFTVDFTCTDAASPDINIETRSSGSNTFDIDNVSVRELYPFEQYNPSEGTIVCETERNGTEAFGRIWELNDGTSDSFMTITSLSATGIYFEQKNGGVDELDFGSVGSSAGETNTCAYAYQLNNFYLSASKNGQLQTPFGDTSVTVPAIERMGIGCRPHLQSNLGNFTIKRLTYYPYRLNDDVCDSKVTS